MDIRVEAIDHVVLTVRDLSVTIDFYELVLGMEATVFAGDRRALRFGDQKINLHEVGDEDLPNARHAGSGTADLCFLTSAPLDAVVARLRALEVEIAEGPAPADGARGPLESVWIRDPDGNLIEVANRAPA
ncbi:MAG: VOC family protein [Thermoleophilaceae bacterium]|nr:VOC family protein [Thermoleophilaceae bacterium]